MADLFKASEIVSMAVQEERNGVAFYEALAEKTQDVSMKEFARRMAGEERRHEAEFTRMRDGLGAHVPTETYPGEYVNYVNALVSDRFIPDEGKAAESVSQAANDREVLENALRFEKETMLFFTEMKRFVPEKDGKVIDALIVEERQHITDLTRKLGGMQ